MFITPGRSENADIFVLIICRLDDFDFDKIHKQWLGNDWNGWGWFYDYKTAIHNNLANLAQLFLNQGFQQHEYIYWYCYDYANQCDMGTVAYSWSSVYFFWRNHYTVFCPRFASFQTLADDIRAASQDQHKQRIMENFHTNRGQIMLHEIYHYTVVTNPRTDDYAYQAQQCWDLAKNQGTWYAFENADSYALDAVAIYVQQHFESEEPPIPRDEYAKTPDAAGVDLSAATKEVQSAMGKVFADKPSTWSGAQVPELNPDPSFWVEFVEEGVTPLSADLNLEFEVFGGKAHDPIESLRNTDVPAPPMATKQPEPEVTTMQTDVGTLSCEANGNRFPQPAAENFINDLCNSSQLYPVFIVPPISIGTGSTSSGHPKSLGVSASYAIPDSSDKLYVGALFDNGGCVGGSQFGLGMDDAERLDHCKARLRTALNGCQTSTTTDKQGGMVKDVCIDYVVTARHEDDPNPFEESQWWAGMGDFKCRETDPPLDGRGDTCTCWREGYESTTDIFERDQDGKCDNVDTTALVIN
ncbi:hypothetical protein F5B22DRAFT_183430 [Xylaria bambusicola]|uniref:uncharacterized protein n=1 Tax=Xylaria bambusicola TaxID=326684 RepID=UPI00200751E2|nr:uncharacterized protein F5B22DRAFT_183430 [Xylaria bambusicola]KAI0516856.1 hypothetical protein F5B22DRAFT_183430 [Xylaria bambusicola]